MINKPLAQLYAEHEGKVSDKWSLYFDVYDRVFSEYRAKPIKMMEVGIQNGGSLEIWSKYFPCAEKLIGCDVNPNCSILQYEDPRITLVVGDANSDSAQDAILQHCPEFDIVIDDGSHLSSDIVKTFARYFPMIADGGVFVAEDLHCSYWREFEGGLFDPFSAITFFKYLADVINHEHWGVDKQRTDLFKGFFKKFEFELDEGLLKHVHSVEFINSTCVVRKLTQSLNLLGERNIAGKIGVVELGLQGLRHDVPLQTNNYWSSRELSISEELSEQLRVLSERDGQIEILNQAAVERDGKIEKLNQAAVERDGKIEKLNQAAVERDGKIEKLNQAAVERDGQIENLNQILAEREQKINYLQNLTQSMRLKNRIKNCMPRFIKRIISLSIALTRRVWKLYGVLKKNPFLIRQGLVSLWNDGFNVTLRKAHVVVGGYRAASIKRQDGQDSILVKKNVYQYREVFIDSEIMQSLVLCDAKSSFAFILYAADEYNIKTTIESLLKQLYPHWSLYIVTPVPDNIKKKIPDDGRIHVISGSLKDCQLTLIEHGHNSDYMMLLDSDIILTRDALYEINELITLQEHPCAIYMDHDEIDFDGEFRRPHYKPDFSLLYFLSYDFIGKSIFFKSSLLSNINITDSYDILLRILGVVSPKDIAHKQKILCHIKRPSSFEAYVEATKRLIDRREAIESFLNKNICNACVSMGNVLGTYKLNFKIVGAPLVSIIIPFKDQPELLNGCIQSIHEHTSYENYEIIGISNESVEKRTYDVMSKLEKYSDKVSFHEINIPFNYSKINNIAINKYAKGDYLILLNNDIEIISDKWIESLLEIAQLDHVGCVGGKLIYPDETVQHAGVVLGVKGFAAHIMKRCPSDAPGYDNRLVTINSYSAITAACLMIKRELFLQVEMFNEDDLPVNFNDVDLSLKVREAGYEVVMTPFCQAYHYESITRGDDKTIEEKARFTKEVDYVLNRHSDILEKGDPFFNHNMICLFDEIPCDNASGFLRIAILCIRMQKGYGVDLVISEQARRLSVKGFKVDVYTLDDDGYFHDNAFAIYKTDAPSQAIEKINSGQYNIVIAHTSPFLELLHSVRDDIYTVAYEHGDPTPDLFNIHEKRIRQSIKDHKLTNVYPVVNQVVAISKFIAEDIKWKDSVIIYNGANHLLEYYQQNKSKFDISDIVSRYQINTDKIIIANISRLGKGEARYKGVGAFLKMAKLLGFSDYEFIILGKGNEVDKKTLESQGVKVILNATLEELIETYIIADLIVSFSEWEGFNLPLVEAQTFSTPAFALNCCVHPEVTENTFENMQVLVDAIAKLDKETFYALGQRSNEFVQKYTWENSANVLIESLLNGYHKYIQVRNYKRSDYQENLVSICILTKDKFEYISECIQSILEYTNNISIEILIGDTGSTDPKVLEFYKNLSDTRLSLHFLGFYNFSKNNNTLAALARGEYLLFLNNDTKVIDNEWLDRMLGLFRYEKTGVVGPKLLFHDDTIQHAGVEIFTRAPYKYVGWHPYSKFNRETYDANKTKIVPAVTGACLLMRHTLFNTIGCFDEDYVEECQDIDLCLKVSSRGYCCVYTPKVELYHYENGTRLFAENNSDRKHFIELWEPYINENIFSLRCQSDCIVFSLLVNLDGKTIDEIDALIAENKQIVDELNITFKHPFNVAVTDEWMALTTKYRARLLPDNYEDNVRYDQVF